MVAFELRKPMNLDAYIYITLGRGLLNGLRPYVDLFESKPPGIFLLAAASLWMTGGTFLLRLVETLSLLFLPLSFTLLARRPGPWNIRPTLRQAATMATAFAFGTLMALRTLEVTGGLQTEIFGLPFAILYVFLLLRKTFGWREILLAALCLLLSLGMKEPFLLSILAAALLCLRTPSEFWKRLLLPLLIAFGAGLAFLWATGWLMPYVGLYLPAMTIGRVADGSKDPLILRVLWVLRLLFSFTVFSPMPLFGWALGMFWCWSLLLKEKLTKWGHILTALTGVWCVTGLHLAFIGTIMILSGFHDGLTIQQMARFPAFTTLLFFVWLYVTVLAALCVLLARQSWRAFIPVACGVAAIVLLTLAIGVGGYATNYMAFTFPACAGLGLLCIRHGATLRNRFPLFVAFLLLGGAAIAYRPPGENVRVQVLGFDSPAYHAAGATLDAIMDACDVEDFAFAGGYPVLGFSRHSPIGPVFTLYFHDYLGFTHPLYQETYRNIYQYAAILVVPDPIPEGVDPVPSNIRSLFGTAVPPCAQGAPAIPDFTLLYRKPE